MGRMKRAILEVYSELRERAKEEGSILMLKKQKHWCKAGDPEEENYLLSLNMTLKW
jgi:hypothetical protein